MFEVVECRVWDLGIVRDFWGVKCVGFRSLGV